MTVLIILLLVCLAPLCSFLALKNTYHSPLGSWSLGILRTASIGILAALALSWFLVQGQTRSTVFMTDQDTLENPRLRSELSHIVARAHSADSDVHIGSLVTRPSDWDEDQVIQGIQISTFTRGGNRQLWGEWILSGKKESTLIQYSKQPENSDPISRKTAANVVHIQVPTPIKPSTRLMILPSSTFTGSSFILSINANRIPNSTMAELFVDNVHYESKVIDPRTGSQNPEVIFEVKFDDPGTHSMRLQVLDEEGHVVHREVETLKIIDKPNIHYISVPGSEKPLFTLLRAAGFHVNPLAHTALLSSLSTPFDFLENGDLVIFDAIPDSILGNRVTGDIIDQLVRKNLALLFIPNQAGGRQEELPFQRVLPVRLNVDRDELGDRNLVIIAMVDTSFSMYRRQVSGGPRKIEMAQRALVNLSTAMPEVHKLGVLGVDFSPYWILHPSRGRNLGDEIRRIERIGALSGGINMYSGLLEAFKALEDLEAEIKHLLILLDTADVDEYEVTGVGSVWDLLNQYREKGITISLIGIGDTRDEHISFLNQFAEEAGGFLYLATDIRDIPGFFLEDLEQVEDSPVIRRPMKVFFSPTAFPGMKENPDINGQILTTLKPGANLLSWTDMGYPLLASWKIGKSTVTSFHADNGSFLARSWVGEDEAQIWDSVLAAVAPSTGEFSEIFVDRRGDYVRLNVRLSETEHSRPPSGLYFNNFGELNPFSFQETAPGIFSAHMEDPGGDGFNAEVNATNSRGEKIWIGARLPSHRETKKVYPRQADSRSLQIMHTVPLTAHLKDGHVFRLLILLVIGLLTLESLFRVT